MNTASAIAFDTAEREYNDSWNAPSSTRFELPPTTVSTSSGRSFARATAAPIATAPRVGAGTSLRLPAKVGGGQGIALAIEALH